MTQPSLPTERWHAWDAFLETTPHAGFMQSSWWADFRADHGYEHFLLMLNDGQTIVGGALVLKYCTTPDRCFYYVPEGPVLPSDNAIASEVWEALLEEIQERRLSERAAITHLRIEPRLPRLPSFMSGFRAPPRKDAYTEPRNTLCIDLRPSEEEILAQMKPKGRYNLRVARRHGVSVFEDSTDQGIAAFVEIYHLMVSRQGIDEKPADYFELLGSLLFPERRGSLFFAEYEGKRIATALVVYFGDRATYFFGGSLYEQRSVMAPYALHFEIIRSAKAMGYAWYDLWGVAPDDSPDDPWHGISVFKRKFGGVEVRLVPTLDYVFDQKTYDQYVTRRRATPEVEAAVSRSEE